MMKLSEMGSSEAGRQAIVFGAGGTGRRVYNMIKGEMKVVCFVDNDFNKWGGEYDGVAIENPEILRNGGYDQIVLGTLMGLNEVQEQLRGMGIPLYKLDKTYVEISVESRNLFCKRFAQRVYKEGLKGAAAEAGVFRGEFAKVINEAFYDRKCYLFDTFDGFDERDFAFEEQKSMTEDAKHLKGACVEIVLSKMLRKENVIIKQGYFPETADGLEGQFVFVNLDMDLYHPTLEGLRIFYPRMVEGGVILIHDYFSEAYPNVEKAVDDFEREVGIRLRKMPIGDDISIAILK